MTTVIGVGMQMTASASGMTKGLSEADRALQLLQKIVEQNQESLVKFGAEADKTAASLERIGDTSSFLATIEVGRVLIDIAQTVASAFTQVGTTISSIVGPISGAIDATNDLAARTGINVEQLQKYGFAAKLAGVDTAAFGKAVQALTLNIGKANPGDELDKSLKRINLSVAELRSLAPEKQFSVIGEQISQLPTAADRAAAAVSIFGKQGAALAPLFREGAASIEELQARAERLGIIVSETQVNNVAQMNDAFDTVRATIEGIIGQVIGNLAPAVTAVTEEFLKFVEEWSGAQGTGGTGIANAITDVLLRGAEYFAGIFDGFVKDFSGFVDPLRLAGETFSFVGNTLVALAEAFRAAFNVFELAGNAIVMGLGKLLEGLGSWVNKDLEQVGRELAAQAQANTEKNSRELEAAAKNAANATAAAFGGAVEQARQAGDGAATEYFKTLRERIAREQSPVYKFQTNLETATKDLDQFLKTAEDGGSTFLRQSQDTLATFAKLTAEGTVTKTQLQLMSGFVEKINGELQKEKGLREQARAATEAQAQADEKRIADLEKAGQVQNKIADDLAAVEREQARVQQELNAARDASQRSQADQASARLAQLDQLQAKLQEQQRATEQGFADGYGKAFEATNKGAEDLIQKTQQFGTEAVLAAQALRDGIADTQAKVRQGILSREGYEAEIAARQQAFAIAIENVRKEEEAKLAAAKRVDDFLKQGVDARVQAELEATKQIEERKKQAAQNVAAIQQKINEEEIRNQEARDKGKLKDARDSANRLRALRGLQREEEGIAKGTNKRVQQTFAQAAQQQNNTFNSFANAATQQVQKFNNAMATSVTGVNAALEASAAGLRKIARQERASLALGPQQIATADARTAEGQQMILDAAAQYQDPTLIQLRQSNKVLNQIATGLTQNLQRIGMAAVIS